MHCCETNASRIIFPPLYLFWRGGSSTLDENDDFLNKYYVPEVNTTSYEAFILNIHRSINVFLGSRKLKRSKAQLRLSKEEFNIASKCN